jgi:hypothetical protein
MSTAQLNGGLTHVDQPASVPASPAAGARPLRQRLLGELLVREGLVTESQLDAALRERGDPGGDEAALVRALVEQGIRSPQELAAVLDRYHRRYRLGDMLLEAAIITESQLEIALDQHRRTGLRLGDALLQLGFVGEEELKQALCAQLDLEYVDLDGLSVDPELGALVPREYARHHRVVPVARAEGTLTVAVADPTDGWLADDLQVATGCRVRLVASTDAGFERAFARVYGTTPAPSPAPAAPAPAGWATALARETETMVRALAELRAAQEAFVREHDDTARSLGEERARHAETARVLGALREAHGALQVAHGTLQGEHAATRQELAEGARREAETARALETLRADFEWLVEEHESTERLLAEERTRGEGWARSFAEVEGAYEASRREAAEHRDALERLREEYSAVSRALAELRGAHETLRVEHDRVARELEARCRDAESRQGDAVQQLEAVLKRLRA